MITLAATFHSRLMRELRRALGADGRLVFYKGPMPLWPDDPALNDKVAEREPTDEDLQRIIDANEPDLPEGARYWRLLDNGGLVLMQGDGQIG